MLILENKSRNVKIFRKFQRQGQAQESLQGTFDRGKKRVGKKQKKGRLFRFVRNLVVAMIVLFVILMLLPDDEETGDAGGTVSERVAKESDRNDPASDRQNSDNSGAEEVTFPADMVSEKEVTTKGDGTDTVTVFVYMNGSDLESEDGSATDDLEEMLEAKTGDKVQVLIETVGTKEWSKRLGIASDHTQRYRLDGGTLVLEDDSLGQEDSTQASTLSDFIRWGAKNYPADRNLLIFWDHGAGPVYGFGYDENQEHEETLTMDQMRQALQNGGIYFDVIGMDCCIMSSMELCLGLQDYCDYLILSEDFEMGIGWSYTGWLRALEDNTSLETPELGRLIVDDMVSANENDQDGGAATLALIDASYSNLLYTAWKDFAYANERSLLGENYSMHIKGGRRAHPVLKEKGLFDWIFDANGDYDMSDYYITDIMAVAQNIQSEESKALEAALQLAVAYFACTSDEVGMTGLSVTLPYGDPDFYVELSDVFSNSGLEEEYVNWLGRFVRASGVQDRYKFAAKTHMLACGMKAASLWLDNSIE